MSLTVVGGNSSQRIDAFEKDTKIEAHATTEYSFKTGKRRLETARTSHQLMAKQIKDKDQRAIEMNHADDDYYAGLQKLQKTQATHQANCPVQATDTGSAFHWLSISLFSLACSLVVVFVSGFLSVYYKTLVASPAFSLKAKANHAWESGAKNFKASNHEISPIGDTATGYAKVNKALPSNSSQTVSTPHPDSLNTPSGTSDNDTGRTPNTEPEEYNKGHYQKIKNAVLLNTIKPTLRPVKAELIHLNIKFVTDAERQAKAVSILAQLKTEGGHNRQSRKG